MKKILLGVMSLVLIISGFTYMKVLSVQASGLEGISEKLIRFHVLANSNSDDDQELKLKVRDDVIKYLQPILKGSSDIDESREVLLNNIDKVIEIANERIKKEGYDYTVKAELAKANFPVKTYGNITLPQGEYEAFRILIGDASGDNWWCVMFPPLCFVDMTKGQISYEESEKQLEGVLTDEENDLITREGDSTIEFRFKLLELFSKDK